MTPKTIEHPADLARLIPVHMRHLVKTGKDTPHYRVNKPDYDRLPIGTFLFMTMTGTAGRVFEEGIVVVKPNDPSRYPRPKLTDANRLLYCFWKNGMARKALVAPRQRVYRHIVPTFDPRWEMTAAFKFACDHLRAMSNEPITYKPDLLYRALGVEPWPEPLT
jgi:hypothetical protein